MKLRQKITNIFLTVFVFTLSLSLWVGSAVTPLRRTLDIDARCEPDSTPASWRAWFHGQKFWDKQLELLDQEIAQLENLPKSLLSQRQLVAQGEAEVAKVMENFYIQHPEARPTPAQDEAERLRKKADEIEEAEVDALRISENQKRLQALNACRPVVANRTDR